MQISSQVGAGGGGSNGFTFMDVVEEEWKADAEAGGGNWDYTAADGPSGWGMVAGYNTFVTLTANSSGILTMECQTAALQLFSKTYDTGTPAPCWPEIMYWLKRQCSSGAGALAASALMKLSISSPSDGSVQFDDYHLATLDPARNMPERGYRVFNVKAGSIVAAANTFTGRHTPSGGVHKSDKNAAGTITYDCYWPETTATSLDWFHDYSSKKMAVTLGINANSVDPTKYLRCVVSEFGFSLYPA